jgi:alkylhydroperoxidase family enzyme
MTRDAPWPSSLLSSQPLAEPLRSRVRARLGFYHRAFDDFSEVPWMLLPGVALIERPYAHAPELLVELTHLVVSQENSCRYCYGEQRAYLRLLGYSEKHIDRLESDLHAAGLSGDERALLEFVRKVSRSNPRPATSERATLLAAGASPVTLAELVFCAGLTHYINRVATLLERQRGPTQAMLRRRWVRWLRPLVSWRLRRMARRAPVREVSGDGPGGAMVAALAGSPAAAALREILDEMWASTVLPRRTKALLLAVVGRALGCPLVGRELGPLLASEGLTPDEQEAVLAHLHSPKLTPTEARLLPFARATVRYQPEQLRAHLKECADLAPVELLEAIGVTSLANALCRMTVLVAC